MGFHILHSYSYRQHIFLDTVLPVEFDPYKEGQLTYIFKLVRKCKCGKERVSDIIIYADPRFDFNTVKGMLIR